MEEKKSVGIWIRVSTEDQAKGQSPEHHEERARYYAKAKGWEVRAVYNLEAISGKSVIHHEEAKRMLEDVRQGFITGLIFSKLARLARSTRELLDFSDKFREHGADLISLQESIDTSTPAGRLFYTVISAMAQWEREEIADRVAVSVPIRARLGKPIGGQASFGYKWEGKNYLIDEKEAPIRKLIYETFLKHRRKKTTANELNEMGYRTRNGSKFSDTTIDRLIRDPNAKGERRANYTKTNDKNRSWDLKPESEWIIIPCPAIVSKELWTDCNRILDDQYKKRDKTAKKAVHLLSGYLYCDCGNKMYVFHEKSAIYSCKKCKRRMPVQDIDEIYHGELHKFFVADMDVNKYRETTTKEVVEKENLLAVLFTESKSVQEKMSELVKMRMNKEMTPETFVKNHRPLEQQLEQIEEKIPELQAEVDVLKVQALTSEVVVEEARNLYEQWGTLAFEQKRTIVESITNKITIGNERIHFSLAHIPTSLNAGNSQRDFRGS